MNKGLKIFVWVMVFLGVLSAIFLLTAKKKPQPTPIQKNISGTKKPAIPAQKNPTTQSGQTIPKTNTVK